jgi:hypothetical protein
MTALGGGVYVGFLRNKARALDPSPEGSPDG